MTEEIEPPVESQTKQRHGCLTAYLIFMIIANSATAIMYIVGREAIRQNLPNMPDWAFLVLIVFGVFNLICAIALFRWKKWGFWGFIVSSCVAMVVNFSIGLNPVQAMGGLVGIAILYGVLQIGDTNKGWPQLE